MEVRRRAGQQKKNLAVLGGSIEKRKNMLLTSIFSTEGTDYVGCKGGSIERGL